MASPVPAAPRPPLRAPPRLPRALASPKPLRLWPGSAGSAQARLCPALPDSSCLSVQAEPPGQFSTPRAPGGGRPGARTTGAGGWKPPAHGVCRAVAALCTVDAELEEGARWDRGCRGGAGSACTVRCWSCRPGPAPVPAERRYRWRSRDQSGECGCAGACRTPPCCRCLCTATALQLRKKRVAEGRSRPGPRTPTPATRRLRPDLGHPGWKCLLDPSQPWGPWY